ncbi:MAG: hypothetical protein K0S74_1715 [Chlamydiales bacterium]|jgi:TPR repeat protein|nr:hypothetical protein [Chlamydiales bacterium]
MLKTLYTRLLHFIRHIFLAKPIDSTKIKSIPQVNKEQINSLKLPAESPENGVNLTISSRERQLYAYFSKKFIAPTQRFNYRESITGTSSPQSAFDQAFNLLSPYFSSDLAESRIAADSLYMACSEAPMESLLFYNADKPYMFPSHRDDHIMPYDEYTNLLKRAKHEAWGILALHTLDACGYIRELALKELWDCNQLKADQKGKILPYLLLRIEDHVDSISKLAEIYINKLVSEEYIADWTRSLKILIRISANPVYRIKLFQDKLNQLLHTDKFKNHLIDLFQGSKDIQFRRSIFDFIIENDLLDPYQFSLQVLEDKDTYIRLKSARYLEKRLTQENRKDLFQIMMCNKSNAVRKIAFIAYDRDHNPEEMEYYIKALIDSNKTIREGAQYRLKSCFDCKKYYYNHLKRGSSNHIKSIALIGLVEVGAIEYLEEVRSYLTNENPSIVSSAINALGTWKGTERENLAYHYLSHKSSKVRWQCTKLLKRSPQLIDYIKIQKIILETHEKHLLKPCIELISLLSRWDRLLGFLILLMERRGDLDSLVEINLVKWIQQYNKYYTIVPSEIQSKWFYALSSMFPEKVLIYNTFNTIYSEFSKNFKKPLLIEPYPFLSGNILANTQYLEMCLLSGSLPIQGLEEAFSLITKRAEKGELEASFCLGYCYQYGIDYPKNLKIALNYYIQAANKNLSKAALYAGDIYHAYPELNQNSMKLSIDYYKLGADLGNDYAKLNLAVAYSCNGIEEEAHLAVCLFTELASKGNRFAIYNLGNCYEFGLGIDTDKKKANDLYIKASKIGFAPADYMLGVIYDKGNSYIRDNSHKAFSFYFAAAQNNHLPSLYNVAACYFEGIGCPTDVEQAFKWYQRAKKIQGLQVDEFDYIDCKAQSLRYHTLEKNLNFYYTLFTQEHSIYYKQKKAIQEESLQIYLIEPLNQALGKRLINVSYYDLCERNFLTCNKSCHIIPLELQLNFSEQSDIYITWNSVKGWMQYALSASITSFYDNASFSYSMAIEQPWQKLINCTLQSYEIWGWSNYGVDRGGVKEFYRAEPHLILLFFDNHPPIGIANFYEESDFIPRYAVGDDIWIIYDTDFLRNTSKEFAFDLLHRSQV